MSKHLRPVKLVCGGLIFVLANSFTAQAAQTLADQQVQAVFGVAPWKELFGPFPAGIYLESGYTCAPSLGYLAGSDIFSASKQCVDYAWGFAQQWFRSDLGVDSNGSAPPSGLATIRCTPFLILPAGGQGVHCDILYSQYPSVLIASNQTATTIPDAPTVINLSNAYIGAYPTSAAIIGTPIGGEVTGLPGTVVTFTPTPGFMGVASFNFDLGSARGTSNTATASISVVPTIVSRATKATAALIGASCGDVSNAFDGAAIASEGPANLLKNISISVAVKTLAKLVSAKDEIMGQGIELSAGYVQFLKASLKRLTKTNMLSLALEADSLIFGICALTSSLVADDPPDPNYQTVAVPSKLSFPSTGNSVVDKVIADYLSYASFDAASLHAAERYQGAILAGDKASAALQNNAFKTYSQQMAKAQAVFTADNAKLAQTLPSVNITTFPGGAAAIAAAFNAQCGKPLPSYLNNLLLSYGISQSAISTTVCTLVGTIVPSDITTDFKTPLLPPTH